jgi:hypothetical protein
MGWLFPSEKEKWAKAKTRAHKQRAANGQKVTKSRKTYTPAMQIADQKREIDARNKRLFG